MSATQISPPAVDAIDLTQVKHHLRIELDDDDEYLSDLIKAATDCLQNTIRRKLITQVWRQYADFSPAVDIIRLETYPVQAIEQVTGYNDSGSATQLAPEQYQLYAAHDRPFLKGAIDAKYLALEIDVRCGYGDNAASVPAALRQALMMLVSHWFEFRGATAANDQPVSLPSGFEPLVAPFRRPKL